MITVKGNKKPKRGDPCPCGSTLKYRNCHGSGEKQRLCNEMVRQYMLSLIAEEMIKKGIMCEHGVKAGEKCVDCSGAKKIDMTPKQIKEMKDWNDSGNV